MPTFDPGIFGKMFARVFLREDAGTGFMKPGVSASVIEMPVRVDQLLDRILVDASQCRGNIRTRSYDLRIHKQVSVRPCENRDVSAGTEEH